MPKPTATHRITVETPEGAVPRNIFSVVHMNGGIEAVTVDNPDRRIFWPYTRIWNLYQIPTHSAPGVDDYDANR